MVEDKEGIYECKMNTSDWPYLFENAKEELAGFDPVSRKQGAYLSKEELLTVLRVFEYQQRKGGLYPWQSKVFKRLMAVYYGREEE